MAILFLCVEQQLTECEKEIILSNSLTPMQTEGVRNSKYLRKKYCKIYLANQYDACNIWFRYIMRRI